MEHSYGIVFPVYNEEKRIKKGIDEAYSYISSLGVPFSFLIVDNGSIDDTQIISRELCNKYEQISYLKISEKGVGVAFRSSLSVLNEDIIGYMDIDLSTDISCFSEVVKAFSDKENVDIVNGSRYSNKSMVINRRWYRSITSQGLVLLLKLLLNMKSSDAICGFKFFKRECLMTLIKESSEEKGWFYIIELLIRAEKEGMSIYELPVRWEDEPTESKVNVFETVVSYLNGIIKLKRSIK